MGAQNNLTVSWTKHLFPQGFECDFFENYVGLCIINIARYGDKQLGLEERN